MKTRPRKRSPSGSVPVTSRIVARTSARSRRMRESSATNCDRPDRPPPPWLSSVLPPDGSYVLLALVSDRFR